jgi:hypothetical protein
MEQYPHCELSGCHRGSGEDWSPSRSYAMLTGKPLPTFWWSVVPPLSRSGPEDGGTTPL